MIYQNAYICITIQKKYKSNNKINYYNEIERLEIKNKYNYKKFLLKILPKNYKIKTLFSYLIFYISLLSI